FVVLPQEHALCTEDEIEWEAIRDEHFILRRSDPGPAIHDHVIKQLADLGYHPKVFRLDVGRETAMHLVAMGLGVSLTSEATTLTPFQGPSFDRLLGTSSFPSAPCGYGTTTTRSFGDC